MVQILCSQNQTVLPTARHCYNIFLKAAVLPGHKDVKMGSTNLLHTLA